MQNPRFNLALFLAAGLTLAAMPASAQDYVGVVKRSSGQVLIEREGVKLAPSNGLELMRGDRLITGPDGYAQIKLRGAAPISISPDADIAVDRFLPSQAVAQSGAAGVLQRLTSFLAVNRLRH